MGIKMSSIYFKIVWWNTSLSPNGKQSNCSKSKEIVFTTIHRLILNEKVDVIALGEISDSDLAYLKEKLIGYGYIAKDMTGKIGRLNFDTAFIYKKERMKIFDDSNLIDDFGRFKLKTASQIGAKLSENESIYFFISHWPSRRFCEENSAKRVELAINLRKRLQTIRDATNSKIPFVLMGDYNSEPFSKEISQHLLATRDRSVVKKNVAYLYNPFWCKIGESVPFEEEKGEESCAGSYFYNKSNETRWYTFDQIIISSHFLNKNGWYINETKTGIMNRDLVKGHVLDQKYSFDHLPVILTLEKIIKGGQNGL